MSGAGTRVVYAETIPQQAGMAPEDPRGKDPPKHLWPSRERTEHLPKHPQPKQKKKIPSLRPRRNPPEAWGQGHSSVRKQIAMGAMLMRGWLKG